MSDSDKTISESVFNLITDVIPQVGQAYSSATSTTDQKEQVQWIRFEKCDVSGTLSCVNSSQKYLAKHNITLLYIVINTAKKNFFF